TEDRGAALDEGLDLEVLFPHRAVAQVLRQTGLEEVGRLEDVAVGRDHETLSFRHATTPCVCLLAQLVYRSVQESTTERVPMAKRWTKRPEGSTWGDFGDDDELGRINLVTPKKVLEGVREV